VLPTARIWWTRRCSAQAASISSSRRAAAAPPAAAPAAAAPPAAATAGPAAPPAPPPRFQPSPAARRRPCCAAPSQPRRPRGAAGGRARVTGPLWAQVPLPDAAARLDILRTAVRGMALAADAGGALPALAARLEGHTGAELRRMCTEAALAALRESVAAPEVSRHVRCPARARMRVRACWRMRARACVRARARG
jgi:hypothetical protein